MLLEQLNFANTYPMFKYEHGETYRLQSAVLSTFEKGTQESARVWIENPKGSNMDILPFFVVPGELSITKEDKEQILAYESYNGKTIKFFSPEGTEKQTSGKILEKLNLLLRDKQKEQPFKPESFTKEVFINRIADENKLILDTLVSEKKYIPGIYVHRADLEIKLREWIGAKANIFFISAEAGSGKTNLLLETQKQYAAQNLSVLFIRAARMEKLSLRAQIAYLLNIQPEKDIEAYPSIPGTQANPTFIFIDGLNEAAQAESLWQEIIDISKDSIPGSLKFVVSSRANTSVDLNSFTLNEADEVYLYGEKKEGHIGLSAYVFWLTALNMTEMKSAWEAYVQTNKNKYKPQFSFDDLATFDRSIYNLISNPLVLRIFLETYHNKNLPKKGNKYLNIWQDWLATFSEEEITFLKLLAKAIWDKGENELLLDDLLKNQNLKPYLTSDLVNAPYSRLKNLGWISRYVKDLNACLSYTVEGSLLYLMGKSLHEKVESKDQKYIQNIIKNGTNIQQSAVESFLSQMALDGDLSLVCELIDAGEDYHHACNSAMILFLKKYGVKLFIEKIFSEPTDNDWIAMLKLDNNLEDLQEHRLQKMFLSELMPMNTFSSKSSLELGLKACSILDMEQAHSYLYEIEKYSDFFSNDINFLYNYGNFYKKFQQYEKAIDFYQMCLNIQLKTLGEEHIDLADTYNNIGIVYDDKGEYEKAIDFYQKSLDIRLKILGEEHPYVAKSINNLGVVYYNKGEYEKSVVFLQNSLDILLKTLGAEHTLAATSYNNFGVFKNSKGEYDKAIDFYQKSLDIRLKILGEEHPDVADTYNNIGVTYENKGEYDKAIDFCQKCLDIRLKTIGEEHIDVADTYNNIGVVYDDKGEYEKAIDFYQKSLNIKLKTLGPEHPDVAILHYDIGICFKNLEAFESAINSLKNGFSINKKGGYSFQIARCYEKINNLRDAYKYFIESVEIRIKDPEVGLEHKSTIESIENSIRLAKLIGKENELPEWTKKYKK
jgi:tetratricopeptide (TPR) repeat protein